MVDVGAGEGMRSVDGNGAPQLLTRGHEAYLALKARIMRLDLAPGALITESELAAAMGSSKTPVREALARLQRDGLVEAVARTGYRVANMTLKDARDLFNLRTLLEGEAAALAAARNHDIDELRKLDDLCHTSYDVTDIASISDFLSVNAQFHLGVAEAGGNGRLVQALDQVIEQLERFFQLALTVSARADEMVHEHRDLVAAIVAGDAEEARRVAVAQTRTAQAMVVEALLDCDAVQTANLGLDGARA